MSSNYIKLKTNLKLAIHRLKLLGKKKTELSLKSRKEISDYLVNNKPDRARIRVEHIIHEDNYIEAMEIIEMFCDLLLSRFGLIERMKELDPGLDEAISTIIWSAPRISNDILEFKTISEILSHKYGKKYAEACRNDTLESVNPKVKRRLGVEPPNKLLVEQYLIEIAKNFNVNYKPDDSVMLGSGCIDDDLINLRNTVDKYNEEENNRRGGGGGGSGGGLGAGTAALGGQSAAAASQGTFSHLNDHKPNGPPIGFNDAMSSNPNVSLLINKFQQFF
jgi:vacuolar protein sorting-associated protein IST1